VSERRQISVTVNGALYQRAVDSRWTLADFLRHELGLCCTHLGYEHGVCEACTVLLNGQSARSCLTLAVQADSKAVTTVEGLAVDGALNPLQQAFRDHHALQCGFCTPGILISLTELLTTERHPSEEAVRETLSGHLCRCTGYQNIVDACLAVAGGVDRAREIESSSRTVGTRARRVEDEALLTGRSRFVDDVALPGVLSAAFVRSPFAHAAIGKIDTSAALSLPGVNAVYNLNDLRPHMTSDRTPLGQSVRELVGIASKSLRDDITPFVLARDEVCYVGDPVAVVVADSRYLAEDAAALVEVDYEPLSAVSDCRLAARPDAPCVHRNVASNILAEYMVGYGDCDRAFAEAAHVFDLSLLQHRGCAHPMEGRGVLAKYDAAEDHTTIWTSTQSPHEVRLSLVQLLGVDDDKIRVITPEVGGGFGAKYLIYPEEVVIPLASRMLGRPVKWIEDRREHFLTSIQERDQYWDLQIALNDQAEICGIRGALINDQGAYTPQGINVSYNSATSLPGPYRLPNYQLKVLAVETNKVPTMPVRGAGYPQGAFAIERLLDLAAVKLGLDRAEIRRRNLVPQDAMPYTTPLKTRAGTPVRYDSGDFPKCQQMAMEAIGYASFRVRQQRERAQGRYIGVGLANSIKGTGRGPFETGIVRIGRSGRVSVYSGAAPMGQGTKTMLAQIAADQFGLRPSEINVIAGDTSYVPMGHGGFASRQTVNAGSSTYIAAKGVREKMLKVAADLLGVPVEKLTLRDGRVIASDSNLSVSFGDLAREAIGVPGYSLPKGISPGLEQIENFMPPGLTYSNASHCVEVDVDTGTGAVRILRYVVVSDCGNLINPMLVEGQIVGGVVHGIGNALFERMLYEENGQPLTTNFGEYLLPTATELPRIEVLTHISPSPLNPLGVKGVGECGVIPAAAAIMSAIENALEPFGVAITETPLFPERLVELISRGQVGSDGSERPHAFS
jgi:aerobic carbon-monoxide dehydrogenase large subunit